MKLLLLSLLLLLSAFKPTNNTPLSQISYRLAYIDMPELNQTCHDGEKTVAIGKESQKLLEKVSRGKLDRCKSITVDKYNREVLDCSFNLEMVKHGMALCYDKYIHNGFILGRCHHLEEQAKTENIGLWRCDDFVRPTEYRNNKNQVKK